MFATGAECGVFALLDERATPVRLVVIDLFDPGVIVGDDPGYPFRLSGRPGILGTLIVAEVAHTVSLVPSAHPHRSQP